MTILTKVDTLVLVGITNCTHIGNSSQNSPTNIKIIILLQVEAANWSVLNKQKKHDQQIRLKLME